MPREDHVRRLIFEERVGMEVVRGSCFGSTFSRVEASLFKEKLANLDLQLLLSW